MKQIGRIQIQIISLCLSILQSFMLKVLIKIVILIIFLSSISSAELYKKVIQNIDPNAKCLDGSYPAVYFHQGVEKNKFLIYLEGGAYCIGTTMFEVLESCYKRSKTDLGSSKDLPETYEGQGYLSTDPTKNAFAEWTKVFIKYCDGGFYQSATNTPYKYKDTVLYFKGAAITRSHLNWLTLVYDLPSAEKVLFTGSSAGGGGAWLWSGYVRSLLKDPNSLSVVVDSDIFMNYPITGIEKLDIHMEYLYKVANVDQSTTITQCNSIRVGEEYQCWFLVNSWQSIKPRTLLVNSQYDPWVIYNVTDITCVTPGKNGKTLSSCSQSEIKDIEDYRLKVLNFIHQFQQVSKNSVWAISCSNHMYTQFNNFYDVPEQRVPGGSGDTVRSAVQRFVLKGQRVIAVDQVAWPGNQACAY